MEPSQNQNWFARKEALKSFQYLYITDSFTVQFPNVNNWAINLTYRDGSQVWTSALNRVSSLLLDMRSLQIYIAFMRQSAAYAEQRMTSSG